MENVNVDIFAKYQAAAGILAGFAFAAIFQILVTFKNETELENKGSKFFYSIWFLVPAVNLLVSAFLGLAIASNYMSWFSERKNLFNHLVGYLQGSTLLMWIGSFLLIFAVICAIGFWSQDFIDPKRNLNPDKQMRRHHIIMIAGKWFSIFSGLFGLFWAGWIALSFLFF